MPVQKNVMAINNSLYNKWRFFKVLAGILGVLALIPATIDYQFSFSSDRNPQNCQYHSVFSSFWRWLTLLLTLVSILLFIPYRYFYFQWQRNLVHTYSQLPALNKISFLQLLKKAKKPSIYSYIDFQSITSICILLVFPYPLIEGSQFQIDQHMILQGHICYQVSEVLYSFMCLRIIILTVFLFSYGQYRTLVALRHCEKQGVISNTLFSLKCYLKDSPLLTLFFVFIFPCCLMFTLQLRVLERPVIIDQERTEISNFFNSVWLVIVTMTTVGYGDMYPVTTLGRFVAVVIILWAGAILSLTFVAMGNLLQLSNKESIAHKNIELSRAAAKAIYEALVYNVVDISNLNYRYTHMKRLVAATRHFKNLRMKSKMNQKYQLEIRQNQLEKEIGKLKSSIREIHDIADGIREYIPNNY